MSHDKQNTTALIIYDSFFGNTQKIAEAIAKGLAASIKVTCSKASEAKQTDLEGIQLFVVGAPTQGGRPTPDIAKFVEEIPAGGLQNKQVTTFDTRFNASESSFGLKMLMGTIKYAAEKIAKKLTAKGGNLVVQPEGFFVTGKEGPLQEDELERAEQWGKDIAGKVK